LRGAWPKVVDVADVVDEEDVVDPMDPRRMSPKCVKCAMADGIDTTKEVEVLFRSDVAQSSCSVNSLFDASIVRKSTVVSLMEPIERVTLVEND
jgi:hypothetical protein